MVSRPKKAYGGPREGLLFSASQLEARESKSTQFSSFGSGKKAWFISSRKQLFLESRKIGHFPGYLSLHLQIYLYLHLSISVYVYLCFCVFAFALIYIMRYENETHISQTSITTLWLFYLHVREIVKISIKNGWNLTSH